MSQGEQRDDPEHGERRLFEMRISNALTTGGDHSEERGEQEINVFAYFSS